MGSISGRIFHKQKRNLQSEEAGCQRTTNKIHCFISKDSAQILAIFCLQIKSDIDQLMKMWSRDYHSGYCCSKKTKQNRSTPPTLLEKSF